MRTAYEEQLAELSGRLEELAGLAVRALELCTRALFRADLTAAEQALDLAERLSSVEAECSERTMTFLALQSPVAGDLRQVFTAVRVSADLSRMGGLALHIAESARRRYPDRVVPQTVIADDLQPLADLAGQMSIAVAAAVTDPTLDAITLVHQTDTQLDEVHAQIMAALDDPSWPHSVTAAIDVALIARFFERFGDQAVDVADQLHFFVTGNRPRPLVDPRLQPRDASTHTTDASKRPTGRATRSARPVLPQRI